MKKVALIFILFFVVHSAFAGWESHNDYDILRTGNKSIKNFVVSEDGKYIYTLSDSSLITKWDFAAGDSISAIKIKLLPGTDTPAPYYSLSSDAKTYVTLNYKYLWDAIKINVYLYDINTNDLLDSLVTVDAIRPEHHGSMSEVFNVLKCDFIKNKKLLLILYQYDYINDWRYYDVVHNGSIKIIKRTDTNWVVKKNFIAKPLLFNYDGNKLIFLNINKYFSSMDMHSGIGGASRTDANQIYNLEADTIVSISYYKKTSNSGGKTETGYSFPVTTTLFVNNSLYMQNKNLLKIFNLDSLKITKNITYSEYIDKSPNLEQYITPNIYIISNENTINIHNIKNHERNFQIKIDSALQLIHFKKNDKMQYLLFSETQNNIYRISYDTLTTLRANFVINDTIFVTGDTVKFTDRSIGEPIEYRWDFGDGSVSIKENPIHIYSDTGYYSVKLVIKDYQGKISTKTRNLRVIPDIQVDFDYKISFDNNQKNIILNNITNSDYDSLYWEIFDKTGKWELLNKTNLHLNTVSFTDTFDLNYYIRLTLFRYNYKFQKEKLIYTKLKEEPIPDIIKIFEFTDTTYNNYEAIKGFDDEENNLIFHIKGNIGFYGVYKSFKKKWASPVSPENSYIFKRQNDIYTFANNKQIYNFDLNNYKFDKNENLPDYKIKTITSNGNNLVIADATPKDYLTQGRPHQHYYKVYNFQNKEITEDFFYTSFQDLDIYNLMVRKTNNVIDFVVSTKAAFHDQYGRPYSTWITIINGNKLSRYYYFTDFVRLDDDHLIFLNDKNFYVYNNSIKNIVKFTFLKYNFKSIKVINTNSFIVTGDSANHPAYWIFDKFGNLEESRIFTMRHGSFNFAFFSIDNKLLLSGFRQYIFGIKNPYYLKIRYKINKYPPVEPEFKYNIVKKLNTTDVVFQNTTKENCDSLHWELYVNKKWILLNKDSIYANKLILSTVFDTNFTVKMTVYKWGKSFSTADNIKIKVPDYKNISANILFEFTDNSHFNSQAFIAFEEPDETIIFFIDGISAMRKVRFIGSLKKTEQTMLARTWYDYKTFFFRIEAGKYFLATCGYSYIANHYPIIVHHKTNCYTNTPPPRISYYDKYLAVIPKPNEFGSGYCTYYLYDNKNKLVKKDSLKVPAGIKYLHNVSVISTDYFVDNLVSCNIGNKDISYLNGSEIPYTNFIQFIRLNNKNLMAMDKSKINSYEYNGQTKLITSKEFSEWTFTHISKLNDSVFVVSGAKGEHPAYIIMDKSLNVFYKEVFSPIYGKFNFVSKSPDNNLLFAGYRYRRERQKYPYYLKIKSYWKRIEEEKENIGIIFEHYAYPNPTENKIKLRILALTPSAATINIFDTMGNLVYSIDNAQLNTGINELEFNFADKAIGAYYYTIATGTEIKSGKIMVIR